MNAHEEGIIKNSSSVKDVKRRRILWGIAALFLLALVIVATAVTTKFVTLQGAAEDGTELAQQIEVECDLPGVTDPQLAKFCPRATEIVEDAPDTVKSEPVPGPQGDPGEPGEQGDTGEPGTDAPALTDTQVLNALRRFCTNTGQCRGSDGADATPNMVALAVRSYCNANGECRGAPGQNGSDGTDGTDGPPPTEAQIRSVVDSYCSMADNCRGAVGPQGEPGQNGSPGVVNVEDNCAPAPEGQVVENVDAVYDAEAQTITIACTYKDDQAGLLPNP